MNKYIIALMILVIMLLSITMGLLYSMYKSSNVTRKVYTYGYSNINKAQLLLVDPCDYQVRVTDDSIEVYDKDYFVGRVKLNGAIDTLIMEDNY